MCPTPAAASKQPRKPRKTGSVAFKEDTKMTRDNSELLENTSAETANVDPSKKPTSNRRKKTAKGGVKKRAKQKPLPETFTEHNDLMTQDDGGGFLESDFTQKSQKEATCTATTAEIPSEHPCESTEAAKKIKRKGEEEELVEETHYCAICMETFTDISKLHEHYMVHARGI
uniref:C2H2-type domain-containing protein n=1 Tax=Monopterus albus TaxID=43700 RepID=A0A3Q3JIT1_MONAL